MTKKSIFVCVQKDITQIIKWALQNFENRLNIVYFENANQLGMSLTEEENCSMIILDSIINDASTLDFAKEMKKNKSSVNMLLLASSATPKETLVDVIQSKVVSGVLIRPFTAQQASDYVYKFCGLQKPGEGLWYKK